MQPPTNPRNAHRGRGFSLIEMLIALTISATLLTAALGALDAMFKGYQQTAESVSTHVISRIAINRMLNMIRTGSDFGPFPSDVLDNTTNPLRADYFEYVSAKSASGATTEVTRVEYRYPDHAALLRTWGASGNPPALHFTPTGPGALYLVVTNTTSNTSTESLLLSGVNSATFELNYDVGPRLVRATIDIVATTSESADIDVKVGAAPQTIRMIASAVPRRNIDTTQQ